MVKKVLVSALSLKLGTDLHYFESVYLFVYLERFAGIRSATPKGSPEGAKGLGTPKGPRQVTIPQPRSRGQ